MLRKKRQSFPGGLRNKAPTADLRRDVLHNRAMKLKMSPFPEVKGVPLKESNRLNQLTEAKASLQFEDPDPQLELGRAVTANTPVTHCQRTTQSKVSLDLESDLATKPCPRGNTGLSCDCSNSEPEVSTVVKPTVEYVVPDIGAVMSSEKEIKLGSFPPEEQQIEGKSAESVKDGPSMEPTIRPSSVAKLERHMTPRVPRRNRAVSEDVAMAQSESSSLSSVWDSVVTWMKQAVDFVTVEADPTTPRPQGKKRAHPDSSQTAPAQGTKVPRLTNQRADAGGRGVARSRQNRRSNKRMSFGGFQTTRPSEGIGDLLSIKLPPIQETSPQQQSVPSQNPTQIESPTASLSNQFSQNLAFKSPQDNVSSNTLVNPALFKFTAQKYNSSNDGLNSILDQSPIVAGPRRKAPRIRRQSLSHYYGHSVDSPNLCKVPGECITVRRSPRLAEKNKSTPLPTNIPPPPPPPPLPHTPKAPPPPPTPKIPSMYEITDNSTPSQQGVDHSRAMLQKMQSRLRTRMKRKVVVGGEGEKTGGKGKKMDAVDLKTRQWAEIQSLSRKIPVSEFLIMVEEKKAQIRRALEELQLKVPQTLAAISETVELLHDASQWFSGGVKEMRESLPLYKSLEKKIEVLNEFTHLTNQIQESSLSELPEGIHYSELHTALSHIRSEFDSKHRQWGPVVLSNAQSWQELGLPVCPRLLLKAREYVCHLVEVFVKYTLLEAGKIEGVFLSMKCVRTRQILDRLKECMQLLKDSQSYFQPSPPTDTCPGCDRCVAMTTTPVDCLVSTLLSRILYTSLSYINIALGQFEGFVSKSQRQEVCEHFESVLKISNMVKNLVCDLNQTKPSRVKASGVICLIPDGEPLGSAIYSSCVSLIQHILGQTRGCVGQDCSPRTQEKYSKEVILWMMFGCKYVHQTLEVLGSDKAHARGVASLLSELQQMEDLLPN